MAEPTARNHATMLRLAGALKKQHRDVLLIYREAEGHSTNYEDAKAALELLQQQSRFERQKGREGMKIGGIICIAVGAALSLIAWSQNKPDFLVGLIPGLIGVALLVYVYLLAAPLE